MGHVLVGVDPHKLSAAIEVVDDHERMLGSGRFGRDRAGYTLRRSHRLGTPHPSSRLTRYDRGMSRPSLARHRSGDAAVREAWPDRTWAVEGRGGHCYYEHGGPFLSHASSR